MIADWLEARGHDAHDREWAALGAVYQSVGEATWSLCAEGVARFAAAFLGWPIERLAWLAAAREQRPPPTASTSGTVPRSSLDGRELHASECHESWRSWDVRDGDRGVQLVAVDVMYDDGTREGGGTSREVYRVFAGDRAVSLGGLFSHEVYTVGAVDLAPLDLYAAMFNFRLPWIGHDPDAVRAVLGQLADELDPSFDVSVDWPVRVLDDDAISSRRRYEWRDRAIEVFEQRWIGGEGRVTVHADGLPWGYKLELWLDDRPGDSFGGVTFRLPIAPGNRVLARLARVPGFVRES